MFLVPYGEDRTLGLKPMNCPGHMLLFGSACAATATCRFATRSPRRCTATSAPGRCSACCESSTSPRTTRTSSSRRSRSRTRSSPASTSRRTSTTSSAWRPASSSRRARRTSSAPTRSGTSPRPRCRLAARPPRDRLHRQRGRRRLLRAEDRPAHDRRARPLLADGDDPARLADAGQRFGLTYMGADNVEHTPYVIHRALLGSLERFIGILIEHYGGAFPFWLAPVQIRIIPVGEGHRAAAHELAREARRLPRRGRRARRDGRQADPRRARSRRSRSSIVYGDKESDESLAVREHGGEQSTRTSRRPCAHTLLRCDPAKQGRALTSRAVRFCGGSTESVDEEFRAAACSGFVVRQGGNENLVKGL